MPTVILYNTQTILLLEQPVSSISRLIFEYSCLAGEGRKRSQISIVNCSEYSLNVTEPDIVDLAGSLKKPSGGIEPCILKKLTDGHLGKYAQTYL